MRKLFIAGVLALATGALLPQFSVTVWAAELAVQHEVSGQGAAIDISRIKNVLKLTQEQERYWQPVEVALRGIAREQARSEPDGFVRRVRQRVVSIVLSSAAIERLVVAARPLIAKLNDEQKQAAGQLAREMGLGSVVMAALN
jgi:hypothetical protein